MFAPLPPPPHHHHHHHYPPARPLWRQVTAAVRAELDRRGAYVSVAVFWGRERYVRILTRYLERNLRANGGIVRSASGV